MPCPFFLPTEALRETPWERPPRAPLGQLCAGTCEAPPEHAPAAHDCCNFGYARGKCPRFPEDASTDALRFLVLERSSETVRVLYVFERDHAPVEHGVLVYEKETRAVTGAASERLARQARFFVEHSA